MSEAGIPLIMDFGVSHLISSKTGAETATNANKGSLRWQARELLMETVAHHTKESDIWAFGMVVYVRLIYF